MLCGAFPKEGDVAVERLFLHGAAGWKGRRQGKIGEEIDEEWGGKRPNTRENTENEMEMVKIVKSPFFVDTERAIISEQ